jgi:hypothetical protein
MNESMDFDGKDRHTLGTRRNTLNNTLSSRCATSLEPLCHLTLQISWLHHLNQIKHYHQTLKPDQPTKQSYLPMETYQQQACTPMISIPRSAPRAAHSTSRAFRTLYTPYYIPLTGEKGHGIFSTHAPSSSSSEDQTRIQEESFVTVLTRTIV